MYIAIIYCTLHVCNIHAYTCNTCILHTCIIYLYICIYVTRYVCIVCAYPYVYIYICTYSSVYVYIYTYTELPEFPAHFFRCHLVRRRRIDWAAKSRKAGPVARPKPVSASVFGYHRVLEACLHNLGGPFCGCLNKSPTIWGLY